MSYLSSPVSAPAATPLAAPLAATVGGPVAAVLDPPPPPRPEPVLIPREISQLVFNARVLQEARDETVPLLERLRFLGIFSSNQDEYYRVRVATIQRLHRLGGKGKRLLGGDPGHLLEQIQRRILTDQSVFLDTYDRLLRELEGQGIRILTDRDLDEEQSRFVRDTFMREVRPHLTPIMLKSKGQRLNLDERDIYLAVEVERDRRRPVHAIVDIPARTVGRFVRLPGPGDEATIILLEDVVRHGLSDIFSLFRVKHTHSYVVKLTRDADLDLNENPRDSYLRQVQKSVRLRRTAPLVRFVYDATMPPSLLRALSRTLRMDDRCVLVPGGRHHNFKDFIRFPRLKKSLLYRPWPPLGVPALDRSRSLIRAIRDGDILLQTPYQRFSYIIDLLREAAIDPKVTRIFITMYRVAANSGVVGALVNAARNGKQVTAVLELTARFDETTNIEFTDILMREGVRVVFGPEDLKIHAKMGLIERREHGAKVRYGFLGTGNMNEATAEIYADHFLLTAHPGICADMARLFRVIRRPYEERGMEHLKASPWGLYHFLADRIRAETERARRGEPASIEAKLNNLTHPGIISLLYEAAEAGVDIRFLVRGTFSIPAEQVPAKGEFRALSILDRFLEHSRILVFGNGGDPLTYLSSSDWMPRSFNRRIEIAFPIYDPRVQQQLRRYLDLQFADNAKARVHELAGTNRRVPGGEPRVAAQEAIYRWIEEETRAETEAARTEEAEVPLSPN